MLGRIKFKSREDFALGKEVTMNFNQNSSSRNYSLGMRGAGGIGPVSDSATSSGGGLHQHCVKYVYELPYLERKEICRIFDENNLWETLGTVHLQQYP